MADFQGFNPRTNEYLIGIRFNNHKEWFHENKALYYENVHYPMVSLANEVYKKMHDMDNSFNELPKVSRANRDIRFSKNKNPYKECKWFFLRGDGKPDIVYDKPTYFFELSPDWWRMGLFYAPHPQKLAEYRKRIEADPSSLESLIDHYEAIKAMFPMEADMYKRKFSTELSEKLLKWYSIKAVDFTCYGTYQNKTRTDKMVYSPELTDFIFDGFKKLYPLYKYFNF